MATDTSELRRRAAAWYYDDHFGFAAPPPHTDPDVVRNMALCLLTVVTGDRSASPQELSWIGGYFAVKDYPREVIAEILALEKTDAAAIPQMMQLGLLRQSGRILLYDAIRAAHADAYHPGEMSVVRDVARALGIDEASVSDIERLVAEETALKAKRIRVLMPDGHPSLHKKYRS